MSIKKIKDLIAPRLRKRIYVALTYPTAPQNAILPHLPEHLQYMTAHEDQVFISGPFVRDGQIHAEGMTIILTDSEVKAAEFMRNEPLVRRGLRRFELRLWEMHEGTLTIATRLSEGAFTLN